MNLSHHHHYYPSSQIFAVGNGQLLGAKQDGTTTKKVPLKLVQALITKKGASVPTSPSSGKKLAVKPVRMSTTVKSSDTHLDLSMSSTTPFDYPDIVENITLPEGMFETDRESNESDEIIFKPAVEPHGLDLVTGSTTGGSGVTVAGKRGKTNAKKGKENKTRTTKAGAKNQKPSKASKGKISGSTTKKAGHPNKNRPAVESNKQ